MDINYDVLADVLRVLGEHIGRLADIADIARDSGRDREDVLGALQVLHARDWIDVSGNGMNFGVKGAGREHAGRDPAQLLALDLANYLLCGNHSIVEVKDLPQELQCGDLLTVALQELEAAEAIQLFDDRGCPDHFRILPRLRVYRYSGGVPLRFTSVSVGGDFVAGDKNTASDGGIVATRGAMVSINNDAELRQVILQVAEELEREGEEGAANSLREAAEHDNKYDVAKKVEEALRARPTLKDRLSEYLLQVAAGVSASALYQGLAMAIDFFTQ